MSGELRVIWKVCESSNCRYFGYGRHSHFTDTEEPECRLVWDYYVHDDFPTKGWRSPVQRDCPFISLHAVSQEPDVLVKDICRRCNEEYFSRTRTFKPELFESHWSCGSVRCPDWAYDQSFDSPAGQYVNTCKAPPSGCRYALEHLMSKDGKP